MALPRRQFIQTTVTIAAAAAITGSNSAAAVRRRDLKKGYMLNAFPAPNLPLLQQFEMLKAAGFEGVEPRSHLPQDDVMRAHDATGLKIPSVTCGTHSRMLAQPNASARQTGVDGIKQALRDAKRYGAASILVVPGLVTETISYQENWDRTHAGVRACIPLAEELGVKMAIENVWNNFLLSPMEAVRFVDEFKSAAVGFHLDIGNMMYLGWPEQWIRILGPRVTQLHIKEFSRKKMETTGKRAGFDVEYLEGDNNWPEIMKAVDSIGYTGWGIAEPAYRPKGIEPTVRLKQIAERMDRIFAS